MVNNKTWERDERGLLKNINYFFNEDGSINWRKMVPKENLFINKDRFQEGTDFSSLDIENLLDSQLLIALPGIKHVAFIRGFTQVSYKVHAISLDHAAVSCKICWIPNFESNNQPIFFTGMADAHLNNCKSFGKDFLLAIAENRAFIRAVRNFLRINIVGQDELGDLKKKPENENSEEITLSPKSILKKLMANHQVSFEEIKRIFIEKNTKGASEWTSVDDLSKPSLIAAIELLKKIKSK